MTKPISPDEVAKKKETCIPGAVFEIINQMIAKKWNGFSATLLQKDIAWAIINTIAKSTYESILDRGWMDFEDCYREAGWDVEYDKPAYNEEYDAKFTFRRSKRKKE